MIGKWSGVDTKLNDTSFTANYNVNVFNCGGIHSIKHYNKSKNEELIKSNKKLFYKKKRKESASKITRKELNTRRMASAPPPSPINPEKKNSGRRNIDRMNIIIVIKTNAGKLWTIQLRQWENP